MMKKIDYIFETSWEVCNKVGGIYTVVSTKALTVVNQWKDNYICIGPDLSSNNECDDFIEDPFLFRNWKDIALKEGLRIRVGRWNIKGSPVAVLVDFTPFFDKKNDIFTQFWLQYNLNSINGQWDYVEPALFGYAAGKVIESFYNYFCNANDGIVAHFHEWMTGTGVLYLESKVPQIATVFTTHATVLGRCIAGNGLPLYEGMSKYNPAEMAARFDVESKHSLESLSARTADAFTTVSAITREECLAFLKKDTDVLTINGFENDFVPCGDDYTGKRKIAREKLITVARALTQQPVSEDALLVITSGRYEYKNKGIDLFIEGLAKVQSRNPDRELVAFIAVPAGTTGQRDELIQRMNSPVELPPVQQDYVTHPLLDPQHDPILNDLRKYGLDNAPNSKVKVIFVPVYLNGHDGIFNLSYYDFLIGFDLSLFPSYYEPWGYTPLESAAFGIPTVTTSLAGFGKWITGNFPSGKSVWVIERDDYNDKQVSDEIAEAIGYYLQCGQGEKAKHDQEAIDMARQALWSNLFDHYKETYEVAIYKTDQRYDLYKDKTSRMSFFKNKKSQSAQKWRRITIKSLLPEPLDKLIHLANNLWWSWNYEARELFEEIVGKEQWKSQRENPVHLLQMLPLERIEMFKENETFITKLDKVYQAFTSYVNESRTREEKKVAYFSMEFGISNELKIFSGGLGMLAGDYLKEASDNNVNMVGVGLLYRSGYFAQQISPSGEQVNLYPRQSFSQLPVFPLKDENGEWKKISIALPGRNMYARIWRVDVGRIPLYLLDTDFQENWDEDRRVTDTLYGGDHENRLKQELLLGIGGIRMLEMIGEKPEIYHLNEGHAAFLSLERLKMIMREPNMTMLLAIELIRASSLYTTHTPVPAGHDTFSEDLMRKYFSHYPERFNISWEEFMALGRTTVDSIYEKFSMSVLACKLSQEINGVSKIHGRVSREMFAYLYEGHLPEELPIGYVTNGVHYPTWAHKKWQEFHREHFGPAFDREQSNPAIWEQIYAVPDSSIWKIKNELREELFGEIKQLLSEQMKRRNESPSFIMNTLQAIRPDTLTVGFARRFATYKRAHLLFSHEDKLDQLVNHPEKPTTFIFAGKAHPHDKAGQDLIKKIIDFSRKPQFMGKIIFLENYDMILAKKLVSGCDVWLNTPTRPMEASGTSGEKAVMNGVLNFSVLDGWWAEGYRPGAGWAIDEENTYMDTALQDELDAATLYYFIEDKIASVFYQRDDSGIPEEWVKMMKNNFAQIAPHYTMKRQLDDYYNNFYHRLEMRTRELRANNKEKALQLIHWKRKMIANWDNIEVIDVTFPDTTLNTYFLGASFRFSVALRLGNIDPEDVKLEVLYVEKKDEKNKLVVKFPFELETYKDRVALFSCTVQADYVGVWNWIVRMIPNNPLLPSDTDLNLVKWI